MPSEHRLTDLTGPAAAIFGKHPGHGDFIAAGLPDGPARRISDWLGATLGEIRDLIGPGWDGICQSHTALRFWLGGQIAEGTAWRGVMRMSVDKVGRTYPLLVLQAATPDSLPPVLVAQDFYLAAEEALQDLLDQAVIAPAESLAVISGRLGGYAGADQGQTGEHMFWAMRPDGNAEQLLSEVGLTDLICGAGTRSYWWFANPEREQSGILACQGFPDAQAMSWLISGGGRVEA